MKYIYPALIAQKCGKYIACVPDLPGCISSGCDLEDAVEQIADAASGWLVVAEDEGLVIPDASPQSCLVRNPEDILSLIRVDTVAYRAITESKDGKKILFST